MRKAILPGRLYRGKTHGTSDRTIMNTTANIDPDLYYVVFMLHHGKSPAVHHIYIEPIESNRPNMMANRELAKVTKNLVTSQLLWVLR